MQFKSSFQLSFFKCLSKLSFHNFNSIATESLAAGFCVTAI